ncbi:MAG TPA: HAMP domain-containing sensor histidine kinase [Acidimicrobiales bacterium]|nr:HAMP domain-containing sensor histidine kinase [Acidimicrobiales bacterium]
MSLRHRLVAAVLVVGVVLVVAGVVVAGLIRGQLIAQVDQQLERASGRAGVFVGAFEPRPPPITVRPGADADQGFTEFYVFLASQEGVRSVGPSIGAESPPDVTSVFPSDGALADPSPHFATVGAVGDGPRYRVLIEGVPGGALALAQSLRATDHTYHQIVTVEVLAFLAVLLTLCMVSWWLLRHGVRPIEKMAMTANAIADGDLSRRVSPEDEKTEVGRLGIALNTMLGQIEGAFDERQESEDRLRRFVADASHELRTPLTSIRGYAELWRAGAIETKSEQADAMRRVEHEAARMGRLVDDMLLLARLDEGRPLDVADVDLGHIAEDAVRDARAVEPGRPISLSADDGVVVLGDGDRLRQVLANLLANALVHTPAGTPVEVRVRRDGPAAVLEVADHGPGLPPEVAHRVFERFVRADPARARTTGGAGLGLAIVSAVAEAHGGRAEVESSPGEGATFRVVLPATEAEVHSATSDHALR